MKSKTPRTDAEILSQLDANLMGDYLARLNRMIPFARNLELELNAALETIETQREHIAELKSQTVAAMPNDKS
jgi:hypothetical protein